ncbi:MAG: NIPSNAP family protein [Prolixibacteraceae bacterium]
MTFIVIFAFFLSSSGLAKSRDYYQIQVYLLTGKVQQEKAENFLKTAYLPALHRAGIKTVGVFKPIESDTTSEKRVYVWVPFSSPDHFAKIQEILIKDTEYQQKGIDFLGAPFDKPAFLRKESILLAAFPVQPAFVVPTFPTPHSQRIYELRSYEGPTENLFRQKVKMFNDGGEIALFKKLEFNAIFYAEVISGSTMPNLMYMTTFSDMASHDAHWSAFGKHPDWVKLKAVPEYLNTVSKAVKVLLHPTDYSDL